MMIAPTRFSVEFFLNDKHLEYSLPNGQTSKLHRSFNCPDYKVPSSYETRHLNFRSSWDSVYMMDEIVSVLKTLMKNDTINSISHHNYKRSEGDSIFEVRVYDNYSPKDNVITKKEYFEITSEISKIEKNVKNSINRISDIESLRSLYKKLSKITYREVIGSQKFDGSIFIHNERRVPWIKNIWKDFNPNFEKQKTGVSHQISYFPQIRSAFLGYSKKIKYLNQAIDFASSKNNKEEVKKLTDELNKIDGSYNGFSLSDIKFDGIQSICQIYLSGLINERSNRFKDIEVPQNPFSNSFSC